MFGVCIIKSLPTFTEHCFMAKPYSRHWKRDTDERDIIPSLLEPRFSAFGVQQNHSEIFKLQTSGHMQELVTLGWVDRGIHSKCEVTPCMTLMSFFMSLDLKMLC